LVQNVKDQVADVYLSTAYHPQSDGQTEVVNRCLECFLRCMTGERPKEWTQPQKPPPIHLPYFAGESKVESVDRTLMAREQPYRQVSVRQNPYHKLSAKYYGPFLVCAKIGQVAYKLQLPADSLIHPVFYVSQLKKCRGPVQKMGMLPLVGRDGLLSIQPVAILDRKLGKLNNRVVVYILVQWSNGDEEGATWEIYDELMQRFPEFAEQDEQDREQLLVEESDIKNLVYLQAIIKETMHLYPPAPLSAPHQSREDCVVAGYNVPKGTRLFVNLWKLHHDPNVWSDPNEFRPARFLTSQKDVDIKGNHFELMSFGSGRRMCHGVSFALQSLHITLASLLQQYVVKKPSDEPIDMSESFGLTNMKATPLEVLLTPRLPLGVYHFGT
ncbi:cytochrome P450 CYP82D47-like protein, partial [Tanacetum coccineum]